MIITGSQLELSAQSSHHRLVQQESSIRFWTRSAAPPTEAIRVKPTPTAVEKDDSSESKLISLNALILERFFGIKIKIVYPEEMGDASGQTEVPTRPTKTADWGLEISRSTRVVSDDSMDFQAAGKVTTSDGREIEFSLDVSFKRHLEAEEKVLVRYGEAQASVDPLVLQLSPGNMAMSDQSFSFDLDGDGTMEQVPVLSSGSFLLARDLNGDQQVNDGRELFGPETGRGFSELAVLDQDGNRWIDEGDDAYYSLRLWQPDSEGKGTLLSLSEAGVGAISIDSVNSSWEMARAHLAESGVYLTDHGMVGHVGELLLDVGPLEA